MITQVSTICKWYSDKVTSELGTVNNFQYLNYTFCHLNTGNRYKHG